ncbi:hypothetical protein IGI04_014576 [Brassica rapa subsp. trilocularis]|uniref:Retrotransposon gag domain-containing protein n=1 Tax=Brassica rapa subsp. trilocularis TaxID=1813537 RepID=A0ABQ7MML7_BRACM|nr:hypothetical protein IGI04_014576 [Brassica rapa subsp. trilocularis]
MDRDFPTFILRQYFATRYIFELDFLCHRFEVNQHHVAEVMPVLLKSGQSASQEEAVEEMKDCRSMKQNWVDRHVDRYPPSCSDRHREPEINRWYNLIVDRQYNLNIDRWHDLNVDQQYNLNVDRRHDLNVDRRYDLNVDRQHDLNVDQQHDLSVDQRYCSYGYCLSRHFLSRENDITCEKAEKLEVLILKVDENGMLRDEEGHTRNSACQLINAQGVVILDVIVVVEMNDFYLSREWYDWVSQDPFQGLLREDPKNHIEEREDLASRSEHNEIYVDHILCMIFPYSLFGDAFRWFKQLQPGSLTCWEDITNLEIEMRTMLEYMVEDDEQHGSGEPSTTEEADISHSTSASIDITTSPSINTSTSTSIDTS